MPVNQLYMSWYHKIRQLLPHERITRIRNLCWLLVGIFRSKSVHLSAVANHVPGTITKESMVRHLDRFLDNPAVRVREWYRPIAQGLLAERAGTQIRLIVDGSKVGNGHQWLVISLAYRRRAIPLVWTWIPSPRGHSSSRRQLALLRTVKTLLPANSQVLVVGDSEFGAVEVLTQLDEWQWQYALRQKCGHGLHLSTTAEWTTVADVFPAPGSSRWLPQVQLTHQHAYGVNVAIHWQRGEDAPWVLATNLPTLRDTLRAYARRMWIEEMFGDLKTNGFDLERTRIRHVAKLHRLTFVVVLLYLELVTFGAKVIKRGLRRLVDRRDRRDLSLFRIGLYMRERHLTNATPFTLSFFPYP
jgi:hypothetical protein